MVTEDVIRKPGKQFFRNLKCFQQVEMAHFHLFLRAPVEMEDQPLKKAMFLP